MQIMTGTKVEKVEVSDHQVCARGIAQGMQELSAAALLLAVGRAPNTEALDLGAVGWLWSVVLCR